MNLFGTVHFNANETEVLSIPLRGEKAFCIDICGDAIWQTFSHHHGPSDLIPI
ncbi:hypothetical protein [Vibrio japonicus]|uniref:Uncharacterized protein n=1 Tax=Vibrio japonicus TaxID=1824638 RepID=A0ABY5LET7_9VIBR|nr:hypothetical protein [Vibrio japonicus]UUM30346.1 hypothetical protein NP165_11685 [Vibrio japonicus]